MSKEGGEGFRVYVRVRPLRNTEASPRGVSLLRMTDREVTSTQIWIQDQRHGQSKENFFAFHGVFRDGTPTTTIYSSVVSPLIASLLSGFNATCFAYGMTGAGKTHTMFGDMYFSHVREPGIVPLALTDLFTFARQRPATCTVRVSYLEIYNEQVRDLFATRPANRPQGLLLVEDPEKGIIVTDLSEFVVTSAQEVAKLVVDGNIRRTMAPTGANQFSTRSHAVLQVSLELRTEGIEGKVTNSKLSLIDLAGSERAAATENRGVRLLEGANINRSLLALGNCINILSDPEKAGKFVPYRDSKLTRLLKDALGGKTQTVMIACVSPSLSAYEETLHTLKYAERARRIKVSATRNIKEVQVHVSEYKAIIAALKAEVETLRQQIQRKDIEPVAQPPSPQIVPIPQSQGDTEMLGQDLMHNFEEFWELKQSIQEVETLNNENKKQIKALISNLEYVESLNDVDEENRLKEKIKQIHENIKENEDEHNELLLSLQQNLKMKARLQRELSTLQDDRQRDMIQLEITVRTLKMEKMDLYIQNQEMKQKVVDSQKLSEEKEKMIVALRQEVEEMKKQLSSAPRRIEESEVVSEEPSMKSELFPCFESDLSVTRVKGSRASSTSHISASSPPRVIDAKPPPHTLRISDLNHARALRKCESQKAVNRSQSTEGFISGYVTSVSAGKGDEVTVLKSSEEQLQNEEPAKSGFKVASVVVVNKNITAMRKVHNIRPIKKYENLQRVRSSSNTRPRGGSATVGKAQQKPTSVTKKEDSSGGGGKGSIASLLASLHQKILTGEETENLVRKTLKQAPAGETPMVAISLRGTKPAFK